MILGQLAYAPRERCERRVCPGLARHEEWMLEEVRHI